MLQGTCRCVEPSCPRQRHRGTLDIHHWSCQWRAILGAGSSVCPRRIVHAVRVLHLVTIVNTQSTHEKCTCPASPSKQPPLAKKRTAIHLATHPPSCWRVHSYHPLISQRTYEGHEKREIITQKQTGEGGWTDIHMMPNPMGQHDGAALRTNTMELHADALTA